jgi:hypothetical protein
MTDRGVSTTLSYVLTLTIATLLVGGLIMAGSSFVEDRREQVIRQELLVVGEHLASNIEQVDRYRRAADTVQTASVSQAFPNDVTGSTYTVELKDGSPPQLYLNSSRPRISITVNVSQSVTACDSVASGGPIVAEWDTGSSCLEVQNAQ